METKEKEKLAETEKFKDKITSFEKTHQENLKTQKNLISEIQSIQENVAKQNNTDLLSKVKLLHQKSVDECEYQEGVDENITALKDLLEQRSTDDDTAFEEKMRGLHQDHNRNLQHQIEMMAQIDEMKKIYELDQMNEAEVKSDEKAMKNLESIKRDHDRALLKQKQMINDLEMIEMNVLSEQQKDDKVIRQLEKMKADNEKQLENQRHHDQMLGDLKDTIDSFNQKSDIDFEENMRLITQEHNRSLDHQSELMAQIEEMKAIYIMETKEKEKLAETEKFKDKITSFEKTHQENLKTQKNLISEIQAIQENVAKQNNTNLLSKVKLLHQKSVHECEYQ